MYAAGSVSGSVSFTLGGQDSHIQIEIVGGPVDVATTMPTVGGFTPQPFSHGAVTDEVIVLDMYGVETLTLNGTGDYAVISYLSD